MMAAPKSGTAPYPQAHIPGHELLTARVAKLGVRKYVPLRCFADVRAILEGPPS